MNKRIFFSLNFTPEIKKEITKKYKKKLKETKIKETKEKNIHITLLFLGYFDKEKIKEIIELIKEIKAKKMKIRIKGIDSFNSRIIFLKTTEEKKITELHKKISEKLGIKEKKFKVHATIARNKKMNKQEFEKTIKELKKIEFKKETEIKSFELMESILTENGPEYKKIFSFKLL